MNYPNGTNKKNTRNSSSLSYSKRGMQLETIIDESNEYYLTHQIANIHKKPVPITIVDVDYKSRSTARIKEAYFVTPSTTDYNGVYKGKYIDFDAKQTTSKTSFPLQNVHKHQIEHLRNVIQNGGIGFLIVSFTSLDEVFLLPASKLIEFYDASQLEKGPKSIQYQYFLTQTYQINSKILPRLDYLEALDKFLGELNGQQ